VVNIDRGGPGLGNIAPEQADYFQITKGGGHGNYRLIALAPNGAQEMCDLTMKAFDLADKYRNPACIMADGITGQMMEVVEIPEAVAPMADNSEWSVKGTPETAGNLISSIVLDPGELEDHNLKLDAKYQKIMANEALFEEYKTEDADLIVVAYGVVSRIVYSTVDMAREQGLKVGLLRPITLWPFPTETIAALTRTASMFLAVELSTGQMVEDVKLAVNGKTPVHFYGRCGGMVPGSKELVAEYTKIMEGVAQS
jgi:pyruvate/2-oxoacid:ferredoxin oxidoreductase alpha subunit